MQVRKAMYTLNSAVGDPKKTIKEMRDQMSTVDDDVTGSLLKLL